MVMRLIVGMSSRAINNATLTNLSFVQSDRPFLGILSYLIAMNSVALAIEAHKSPPIMPWTLDDYAVFDARTINLRLEWSAREVMDAIIDNTLPTAITFRQRPGEGIEAPAPLRLGVLTEFIYAQGQALFLTYFEQSKGLVKDQFGESKYWPPVWKFGQVVRNSMAHNGAVKIDSDEVNVSWQDLSYSSQDNGRLILHNDLWPADLFFLIKEMDQVIS